MEKEAETSLAAMLAQLRPKHITDVQDCMEMILLHLPAKSLLRMQSVCKGWRKTIQEPQFKKWHLEHNSRTSEPSQLLLIIDSNDDKELRVLDEVLEPRDVWIPPNLGGDWRFAGSCNGLLCINTKRQIMVFNPVTREVVSLPRPTNITERDQIDWTFVELVFHRATGEYKVIFFHWNSPVYAQGAFFMYTLGANSSWRYIRQAEEHPTGSGVNLIKCPTGPGVNVNDTIYWPYQHILNNLESFIISLDLNTDQIGKISLPNQQDTRKRRFVGLTTWDGKLCEASLIEESRHLEMWIFDNFNWTLKYEIQLPEVEGSFRLLAPYSIKRDIIYIWTHCKIYYHVISGSANNIQEIPVLQQFAPIKQCFDYVESLLPVPK